jgi:hypothetical protein
METLLITMSILAQAGDVGSAIEAIKTLIFSIAAVLCLGALIVGAIAFMRGDISVGLYSLFGAGVLAAGWLIVGYLFQESGVDTMVF